MNTLNKVHCRALVTASATMFAVLVVVFLYWRGVSKGSLPSPAQPLVQKAEPALATNPPPAKVVTVTAAPAPKPAAAPPPNAKPPAHATANQLAWSPTAPKPAVVDAAPAASLTNALPRPPQKPAVTNLAATAPTPVALALSTTVTNITPDDERIARNWLENTNQRPAIRVHYCAPDILRLSTELGRGLLVAGNGSTNRSEVFLQFASAKAPQFSPFTMSVAKHFADYSIALNLSPTFPTAALIAYFPDGAHRLAFIPDRPLAELIFTHVARAARFVQIPQSQTNNLIFEGRLTVTESRPVFEIVAVRSGGQQLALAAEPSAAATLSRTVATPTSQAAQ